MIKIVYKKLKKYFPILIIFFVSTASYAYYFTNSVISSFGMKNSTGTYNLLDIGGQSIIGKSTSTSNNLGIGAIYCYTDVSKYSLIFSTTVTDTINSLCIGDVDGDDDLDIVVANDTLSSVYKNNSLGYFTYFSSSEAKGNINLYDIDLNGSVDLVSVKSNQIKTYKNINNTGEFSGPTQTKIKNFADMSFPGDFNNDGNMDLVINGKDDPGQNATSIFLLKNNTELAESTTNQEYIDYSTTTNRTDAQCQTVAMFDIDNDGLLEVVAGGEPGANPTDIYENTGSSFTYKSSISGFSDSVKDIKIGDIYRDQNMGMVMACLDNVRIFRNDGTGAFTLTSSIPISSYTYSVALGDIDNDGDLDLAVACMNYAIKIYLNNGYGSFILSDFNIYDSVASKYVVLADVNNDNRLDFIIYNGSTIHIYKNNNEIFNTKPSPPQDSFVSTFSTVTNSIDLRWGSGNDDETPITLLIYDLRIGTTVAGREVVSEIYGSPLSGNHINTYSPPYGVGKYLKDLPADTTYYWQVRTIDTGRLASDWSSVQSTFDKGFFAGDWPNGQTVFTGTPPSQVTDLTVSKVTKNDTGINYILSWTAPGDDNNIGTASNYTIKMSTLSNLNIGNEWYDYATTISNPPTPHIVGYKESFIITGLMEETTYYFAIRATDDVNYSSPWSSIISQYSLFRSIVINEIAPSQANDKDIIEFYVAKTGKYNNYKIYEGSNCVKVFPNTGDWINQNIPANSYILLNFSTNTADETIFDSSPINVYTTYYGLINTDNLLYLSDDAGLTFNESGELQNGNVIDFVAYANQDLTELNSVFQANIGSMVALTQPNWSKLVSTPKQFDCINSRGLTVSDRAIARDLNSKRYANKGDWQYIIGLSIGMANISTTTASGLGTATITPSANALVNSTGTWSITYFVSTYTYRSNEGDVLTIDIPYGWSTPQITNGSTVGFTTTTFNFPAGYGLSVITGIDGIAGKLVFPVGTLLPGSSVYIVYGDTSISINGQAHVQSSSGTATFLINSDDVGTNVAQLTAGSPNIQVTNGEVSSAPKFVGPNPAFALGEVYSFPNPAKRGKFPTIHIECGIADRVVIGIYNVAAEPVHSTELTDLPLIIYGKYAYEYTWDITDIASGVYVYIIRANKAGFSDIKAQGKTAIIK